jgi:uncharacterized membrane protein
MLLGSLLAAAAIGCADSAPPLTAAAAPYDPEPIVGLTSGATCPSDSLASYESFGRAFMQAYCLRCHTSAITGSARAAPPDKNFDAPAMVRDLARLIDQQAGAGPSAVHLVMPPDAPQPALEERQQLSLWLACGAP